MDFAARRSGLQPASMSLPMEIVIAAVAMIVVLVRLLWRSASVARGDLRPLMPMRRLPLGRKEE